ncbi:MAG TPA: hypothetical protein EYP18_07410 [Desulfobacterales bacterium]|nr:hypothetical protein [Desulfobacterales bacterium]
MSVVRKIRTFELKGSFGRRVAGVAGGRAVTTDTEKFLQKLSVVDRRKRTTSQVFDALRVAGVQHLVHAARLAAVASTVKCNFADAPSIELMCWTAAERQIGRAFEKVGIQKGKKDLAFVVVGDTREQVKSAMGEIFRDLKIKQDDAVLKLKRDKIPVLKKTFSISPNELRVAPLEKLIIERMAMLALAK